MLCEKGRMLSRGREQTPDEALAASSFLQQKQGQAAHLAGEVPGDSNRALSGLWDRLHNSGVGLGTKCGKGLGPALGGRRMLPAAGLLYRLNLSAVFPGHVEVV